LKAWKIGRKKIEELLFCVLAGGELEQIQFLLDTHRFRPPNAISAASKRLSPAVNDKLGLEDT
jgi:hypothetical protein